MSVEQLRAKARAAIKKEGLAVVAERVGVGQATLQRFAHGAGKSHRGTVKLVESNLK